MTLLPEERPIKSPENLAAFADHFRFCWGCGISEIEPEKGDQSRHVFVITAAGRLVLEAAEKEARKAQNRLRLADLIRLGR